jgi:hypothetical protein
MIAPGTYPAKGSLMVLSEGPLLRPIVTRFSDDDSGYTFAGYTDGRHWNGFECPQLPLAEFRRVLDILVAWDAEESYTVIDDQHVRVHGRAGGVDTYVMTAKLVATPDGDLWLFDCGGAWTFVEVLSKDEEET